MATKNFWGSLSSNNTEYRTRDNQSILDVLYDANQDFQYYVDNNNQYFNSLSIPMDSPSQVSKYYSAEVYPHTEGARPQNQLVESEYTQEVGFQILTAALTITSFAAAMMTAEELAAVIQAKLTGFQAGKFKSAQQAIFYNTTRTYTDGDKKRQIVQQPFFNGTAIDLYPVANITYTAADAQHYNNVATVDTVLPAEARAHLIDKVRRKNFKQIEIWMNPYDYYFETAAYADLLVPAENQIGSSLQVRSEIVNDSVRMRPLSPWEGVVGFLYQTPVIKTPMVPQGYLIAVGVDGGQRSPFMSRQSSIPGFNSLRIEVRNPAFPLENTLLLDSWGYGANDRGSVAVLQANKIGPYATPAGL